MSKSDIAEALLALIHSKPQSPTRQEIAALLTPSPNNASEKQYQADILAFFDGVNHYHEQRYATEPAVVSKAKELARKDEDTRNWTRDRDWGVTGLTMGMPGAPPIHDLKGTFAICNPIQPRWALYVQEARQALQAADEAKPLLAYGIRRIFAACAPLTQSDGPRMAFYERETSITGLPREIIEGVSYSLVERFIYQSCKWRSDDLERVLIKADAFAAYLKDKGYAIVWRRRPELRFDEDARAYVFSCRLHLLPNDDGLRGWVLPEGETIPLL